MRKSTVTILLLDLAIAALCAMGIYRVSERATLPFVLRDSDSLIIMGGNTPWIAPETQLLMIDSVRVKSIDEVEFMLNSYHPKDVVIITIGKVGYEFSAHIRLTHYYSVRYLVIQSLATLIFLLIGFAVYIRLPNNQVARTFHHLSVTLGLVIALTTGSFIAISEVVGHTMENIFHLVYILAPIFFLQFALEFPRRIFTNARKWLMPLVSLVGVILFVHYLVRFEQATTNTLDLGYFPTYALSLNLIRSFFALLFFIGLSFLFASYRRPSSKAEKQQLRWVFYGIALGALSFILLWQLPEIILGHTFISEEIMILLSTIAPVSFGIAIIRYKVFDIDVVIKRTIVYLVVIGVLATAYIGVVSLVTSIFTDLSRSSNLTAIIAALIIALLFEPLRKKTQSIIDTKFFRAEYDARAAEREMIGDMKVIYSLPELGEYVVQLIQRFVPVERLGFFALEETGERLRLIAHQGFDILERRGVMFQSQQLKTDLSLPVIRESLAPQTGEYEIADDTVFSRWHIAAALPMRMEEKRVSGFLVLGPRLSGTRFSSQDIEFIASIALQASVAIERIRLHEQIVVERAESERLAELNRLKTYFVSSVSHDLKTPLASIKMFAEMLKDSPTLATDKREKYLSIIEGESERLARLITNVLDFAKLERGVKEYHKERCDLGAITSHVLEMMNYQFEASSFIVEKELTQDSLTITADKDTIADSIMNLLTNAMKYSGGNKNIRISTAKEGNFAFVRIEDNGVGIPADKYDSIFEAFFRVGDERTDSVGGAGLGLSIVKHTIDAHHGRITVESTVGKGSVFIIYLPLEI
jgi:signal transduction histidine kinase